MTRRDGTSDLPAAAPSVDSDTTEAQTVFLSVVESDPERPLSTLAGLGVSERVRARVEAMLIAFMRARALEKRLAAADGEVVRTMAEVIAEPRTEVDRSVPERIRGYRIDRVLAAGPASTVLLAEQETPIERQVALKLIFEDATEPKVASRVELERQILASLEHPNIARIYDFGLDERNRPYLVTEFVRGGAIDEWCRAHPREPWAVVRELFLPVCSALRFAHARGVLHCDLKGPNVLVQVIDGVPHPKVIDFGIARATKGVLAERAGLSDLPTALGTLRWMSPEALEPEARKVDTRTDVFGLGVLLFELIAGRAARDLASGDLAESLRRLLEEPIQRLASVVPGTDADLDAIVAKACAREPLRRYESVHALVDDLERWLAGREVRARRRGRVERWRSSLLRRWRTVAACAIGVAAVAVSVRVATEPARARLAALVTEAQSAVEGARALRSTAGRSAERDAFIAQGLGKSSAALELDGPSTELLELRAQALEEAIIPRLARSDHKSTETVNLVNALVEIRESMAQSEGTARALERLSVALAYQLDTVRGTDAYAPLEERQLALDERLHAENPDSQVYADNLIWTYQRVHDPVWRRGKHSEALALLRRSGALAEEMLARHGRTSMTLYTATAAAYYEAFAEEVEWRPPAIFATASRARDRGTELLRHSPAHHRGATFVLKASMIEAIARIELGDAATAVKLLRETRAMTAPAIELEPGIGFFGFPIAESWIEEVRGWIALGRPDEADHALRALEREIDRERSAMDRTQLTSLLRGRSESMRARLEMLRGDYPAAAERFRAFIVSTRHDPAARGSVLSSVVTELLCASREQPRTAEGDALIDEVGELVAAELSSLDLDADGKPQLGNAQVAVAVLLGQAEELESLASKARELPSHNPMAERTLRWVERVRE